MPTIVRPALVLIAAMALSACFTARQPLVGPDDAVFPYETIVFGDKNGDDPVTLRHVGDAYVAVGEDGPVHLRFMPVGPVGENFYVAQAEGGKDGAILRLFGLVKVDTEVMRADSYMAIAPDEPIDARGFATCEDGTVCIDDLDAYVAYGMAQVGAGQAPDATYTIISLE